MNKSLNSNLKEQIRKKLDRLRSTLGNNLSGVKDIVNVFIRETPAQLDAIASHLMAENFDEAAKIIHKAKVRYGYFGLDELVAYFEIWEEQLKKNERPVNYIDAIKQVREKTYFAIEELKHTEYFDTETSAPGSLPLKGKLVLIAEDDDVNAMVFDLFIKETGADTIVVTDGIQALAKAIEKKPGLIFMDVHMPFFSGLDAIRGLRKAGCQCPIISLSASTRLNERQNSLDAGASDFLVKPVNRENINCILFRYLL